MLRDPESIFAEWRAEGSEGSIDALCDRHPEQAGDLRRIHQEFELGRRLLAKVELSSCGGEDTGGAAAPSPAWMAELLRRLGSRRPIRPRYQVLGELGSGAMGRVVQVWDEDLRRRSAMKVLLAGRDGREVQDVHRLMRFLDEAQITGQLEHPGIVPVHELGLDEEGRVFYTMRQVHGRSLREVLELVFSGASDWSEPRVLGVLLQVCEALAYAHQKGVIHRDLTPANVMVGEFGEVYVVDWGLARLVDDGDDARAGGSVEPSVTTDRDQATAEDRERGAQRTAVVGTPCYMAPEQAAGRVAGPAADVYALGAILYHLLAGRMPYVEPGERIDSVEFLARLVAGPPRALAEVRASLSPELVAITEKAMARRPEDRYPDMRALAADLRAYLENRVVRAHRTGAWVELSKWVKRNRGLTAASVVAVLALVLGTVASSLLYVQAENRSTQIFGLASEKELADLLEDAGAIRRLPVSERIPELRAWTERAGALLGSLPRHRAQLRTLEARVAGMSGDRALPEDLENAALAAELQYLSRQLRLPFEGTPFTPRDLPSPAAIEAMSATGKNELAWALVDPDRRTWGGEPQGLDLARNALAGAGSLGPRGESLVRDTLVWALFANGQFDEAKQEAEDNLRSAPDAMRDQLRITRDRLVAEVEGFVRPDGRARMEARVRELERRRDGLRIKSRAQHVTSAADAWWYEQLSRLVLDLEQLGDPDQGALADAERRLELAETLEERSRTGAVAQSRWREAIDSIADRNRCPAYEGMTLVPQSGLLPISRDPSSGLWEFAHLETGEPPERGDDGTLSMDEGSGIVLVLIPGGTFELGAQPRADPHRDPEARPEEGPVRRVTLDPFFLSKYEMTQAQWLRTFGTDPALHSSGAGAGASFLGRTAGGENPVESVSWDEGLEACGTLDLRLPTEAQWEYAARAGGGSIWWAGDEPESLEGAANLADEAYGRGGPSGRPFEAFLDDGFTVHAPVGSFAANGFGLHDVTGNVQEWCLDLLGNYELPTRAGDGYRAVIGATARVLRGGDYSDVAREARVAFRRGAPPGTKAPTVGLRPARPVRR